VERTPGIVGVPGSRRRFSLHCDPQREEGARVLRALVDDTRRDRLGAFKPLAGCKVGALLAGMQRRFALGTLAEGIG